jgi:hypothetical protein
MTAEAKDFEALISIEEESDSDSTCDELPILRWP